MIQKNCKEIRSNPILAVITSCFRYSQTSDRTTAQNYGKSDGDRHLQPMGEQADYGAYNEAYVMHHWASFGPRY